MFGLKARNETRRTISELLDDLTHLEINTIIKEGMTATQPPNKINDVITGLFEVYKERIELILNRNDVDFNLVDGIDTFSLLHQQLIKLKSHMDELKLRLDERDYIIFLRMKGFCEYLDSRKSVIRLKSDGQSIYEAKQNSIEEQEIEVEQRDKIKLRKNYDLGTETIVMQTRFGIDGDIVTRIGREFSEHPSPTIIDLHDRHTNLSVNYWKSLIDLVITLVSKIGSWKSGTKA